ncbi:hypothetical protein SAMN05660464_0342 [Geodermatophilus dictyosporus]|uniref:Uncharacterized protein n=1 Tax=Geodermatophilus dictyosporus TaxID=1523247 RepID=A0A1I5UNR9_9ACTN|nr:hypothetical protein [Geodermatophilus dictyosporus]SFP96880.1 hypothetical protein SAMN05660464_0342 [Geodermatophilus dictyosporus]
MVLRSAADRPGAWAGCCSSPAAPARTASPPEETVEHGWWQRSASGSSLDLLVVLGLVSTARAVTDLRLDAAAVLTATVLTAAVLTVVVVALADVTVRMAVPSRREA